MSALVTKLENLIEELKNPETRATAVAESYDLVAVLSKDNEDVKVFHDQNPNPLLSGIAIESEIREHIPTLTREKIEEFSEYHSEVIEIRRRANQTLFASAASAVLSVGGAIVSGGITAGVAFGVAAQLVKIINAIKSGESGKPASRKRIDEETRELAAPSDNDETPEDNAATPTDNDGSPSDNDQINRDSDTNTEGDGNDPKPAGHSQNLSETQHHPV